MKSFNNLFDESFGGLDGKVSAYNMGDPGSIPGLGRSPGEGNGNPLQCSRLENPMGGGPWWAIIHGVAKSRTRLSDFTFEMAAHFSTLAWTSPCTEKPGGLQSMGLQRVGCD